MTELKLVSQNGQVLADSREVATMIEKNHGHLIRDINQYRSIMDQNPDLDSDDFFIESQYQAGTGKLYKMYYLTKIGCDMVANKMTGTKGVLFTATYTKKFQQMEQELQQGFKLPSNFKEALLHLVAKEEENEKLQQENAELKPKASYYDLVLQNKSLLAISTIAKDYGMGAQTLNKMLYELGVQYKQGGVWLLYHKYQAEGYTQSKTHTIDSEKSATHTYWTQKGRMFIYRILKKEKGIVPLIERDDEQLRLVR
ncbi:Rha family transcriptional regulator [Virgibacillus sp. 7505]|uniref:phage antirepressor KilAC domain-containing protein n=1 Tax=Virgibacillus sp. 7505 TaxID=2022548 RepID=UPI000BA78842|nr:phage antirepressor KilAC domain-containing protein [Virgibacillus sp. 7505]PAE17254.1 Rha family transcriptional regulator [Virgibacillus sp. 7505]